MSKYIGPLEVVALVSLVSVLAGLWLAWQPLALIVGGLFGLWLSIRTARRK